ncbi:MAG: hypothetical protein FPO08_19235 [Geobacter sp.]|nr:MAG: hypothetical protein FPO08_19235 [Geobacter sp.]
MASTNGVARVVSITLVFLCCFAAKTFASESINDSIKRSGLHSVGTPIVTTMILPQLNMFPWRLTANACGKDGYDLRPYVGKKVKVIQQPVREEYAGKPILLTILEKDKKCICAYGVVRELIPGIVSLSDLER